MDASGGRDALVLFGRAMRAGGITSDELVAAIDDRRLSQHLRASCLGLLASSHEVPALVSKRLAEEIASERPSDVLAAAAARWLIEVPEVRRVLRQESLAGRLNVDLVIQLVLDGHVGLASGEPYGVSLGDLIAVGENRDADLGVALSVERPIIERAYALRSYSRSAEGMDSNRVREFLRNHPDDVAALSLMALAVEYGGWVEDGWMRGRGVAEIERIKLQLARRFNGHKVLARLRNSTIDSFRVTGATIDDIAVEIERASGCPVFVARSVRDLLFPDHMLRHAQISAEGVLGALESEVNPISVGARVKVLYASGYVVIGEVGVINELAKSGSPMGRR